ncbi:MAG: zinc ribbon domain-containing protein [Alistipes sp.]|nr:zinc ribbon domain-containing protein [Alistipes sp.]
MSKMCESCGMPMSKDPQGGGTNADGTRNPDYCSYCRADGRFTFEGTLPEFREICRKAMIENGMSKFMAWLFTRGMGRLPRWKTA